MANFRAKRAPGDGKLQETAAKLVEASEALKAELAEAEKAFDASKAKVLRVKGQYTAA